VTSDGNDRERERKVRTAALQAKEGDVVKAGKCWRPGMRIAPDRHQYRAA
jgi:hypothetical protein